MQGKNRYPVTLYHIRNFGVQILVSFLLFIFLVKPFPPSSVKAEITKNVGLLNVSWTNPAFATIELKFQIQYAVKRKEITWEVLAYLLKINMCLTTVLVHEVSIS